MPSTKKSAWLITNHAPLQVLSGYSNLSGDIIAVDKGLERVHSLGLQPAAIIGDLDSVSPSVLSQYSDILLIRHPVKKNETDTELALHWCLERGYGKIVILNDMQGRFDHGAALIQNLIELHRMGIESNIENEYQRFFFLDQNTRIEGQKGDLLSLISYSQKSLFASSTALQYPLNQLCLLQHQSRGISNVFLADEIGIKLESGLVLAIYTPQRSSG